MGCRVCNFRPPQMCNLQPPLTMVTIATRFAIGLTTSTPPSRSNFRRYHRHPRPILSNRQHHEDGSGAPGSTDLPQDAWPNGADLLARFSRSLISKKDRSIDSIYFRTLTVRANRSCRKTRKTPRMGQDAGSDLCFEVSSRDRIAPDCAIRHPVWPIVALQRRVRFSARLAGFCRIRCHQRRARRAERASFSAFVSNPDFRVPRLRQIGEWALTGAVRQRKRGHPRGPESRPGLPRHSGLARSGPGAARAWIQVSARERGIPLLDGVFPARTGNPNRRHRLRHAPDLGLATGR